MNQERNFGVTEAGVGLTVITCLLVALGYWIILRLVGSSTTPTVEVRPSAQASPTPGADPVDNPQQPRVLTVEQPQSSDMPLPHTANRPQWLPYQEEPEISPTSGIDGVLSPVTPDDEQSIWPQVEPDPQPESLWPEPLKVH
jgi:hypothetical protein